MEKLLSMSLEHGVAGVCILLTIMILGKAGEFVWKVYAERTKEKTSLTESTVQKLTEAVQQSTVASQQLEARLKHLEQSASDFPKLKLDVRRFYAAIKEVAGDRWPAIRDEILKDEFTL